LFARKGEKMGFFSRLFEKKAGTDELALIERDIKNLEEKSHLQRYLSIEDAKRAWIVEKRLGEIASRLSAEGRLDKNAKSLIASCQARVRILRKTKPAPAIAH